MFLTTSRTAQSGYGPGPCPCRRRSNQARPPPGAGPGGTHTAETHDSETHDSHPRIRAFHMYGDSFLAAGLTTPSGRQDDFDEPHSIDVAG